MTQANLYDPASVARLFDEMAGTYGFVNLISSFGFTLLWRKQCLRSIAIPQDSTVLDLMTGMGELGPDLIRLVGENGKIHALDISTVMCGRAKAQVSNNADQFEVLQGDALVCPLEDRSVDAVVSTFGLKTFSSEQLLTLAEQVERVLRPGGQFAFLEISVPKARILRWPYQLYINVIVPWIGRLALGNPENYRMLGIYTEAFQNCRVAQTCFADTGLTVHYHSYFFGCATGISGYKPS